MVGTGVTPEGIHNSYIAYEFMMETAWRNKPVGDIAEWSKEYARRRYGGTNGNIR